LAGADQYPARFAGSGIQIGRGGFHPTIWKMALDIAVILFTATPLEFLELLERL